MGLSFPKAGRRVLNPCTCCVRSNPEKRTWRLTVEQGEPRLEYGTDNPEDTPIAFSCKPGRGPVDVWINETGKGVNANRSMVASLTAGRTTSKVRGKTLTNEEAGSPSFQGTLPASDPLFATLSKERTLVLVVAIARPGSASRHWQQGGSVQSIVSEEVRHCASGVPQKAAGLLRCRSRLLVRPDRPGK